MDSLRFMKELRALGIEDNYINSDGSVGSHSQEVNQDLVQAAKTAHFEIESEWLSVDLDNHPNTQPLKSVLVSTYGAFEANEKWMNYLRLQLIIISGRRRSNYKDMSDSVLFKSIAKSQSILSVDLTLWLSVRAEIDNDTPYPGSYRMSGATIIGYTPLSEV